MSLLIVEQMYRAIRHVDDSKCRMLLGSYKLISHKRFYVKYSLSQREISTVDLFCNIMSDAQINKYSIILSKLSELSDLSNFPDYPTFATWISGILRDPKSVREETAKRILQALHQKTDYKP